VPPVELARSGRLVRHILTTWVADSKQCVSCGRQIGEIQHWLIVSLRCSDLDGNTVECQRGNRPVRPEAPPNLLPIRRDRYTTESLPRAS